jgi:hypothetical protein
MSDIYKIVAGMGMLIFVYLLVYNYTGATSIISTLGKTTNDTVKNLQGR